MRAITSPTAAHGAAVEPASKASTGAAGLGSRAASTLVNSTFPEQATRKSPSPLSPRRRRPPTRAQPAHVIRAEGASTATSPGRRPSTCTATSTATAPLAPKARRSRPFRCARFRIERRGCTEGRHASFCDFGCVLAAPASRGTKGALFVSPPHVHPALAQNHHERDDDAGTKPSCVCRRLAGGGSLDRRDSLRRQPHDRPRRHGRRSQRHAGRHRGERYQPARACARSGQEHPRRAVAARG